ncbi:hypothetical protein MMC30_004613 [Trapelia coarctata]|nr:hypothetical protein [Trapelia coarctata]
MSSTDEDEVPMLVSVPHPSTELADFDIDFDNEHPPAELTENFTYEHQVFVAYLKRHIDEEEIADRLLALFPDVVEGQGPNAHGKLMSKWVAIARYVAMMTSRWAPVQDPGVDLLMGYSWGKVLVEEFEGLW